MKTKWYKLFVKMKYSALLFFREPLLFTRGIIRLVCMQQKWGLKKERERERERERKKKFPQTMILQILLHFLSWSGIIHFLSFNVRGASLNNFKMQENKFVYHFCHNCYRQDSPVYSCKTQQQICFLVNAQNT